MKTVVVISGSGSNLQAFIDQADTLGLEISAVVSNRADAYGLERARIANIPCAVINHRDYESRESFDAVLRDCIEGYGAELVILAGFMRILSSEFTRHFTGRMLNIHPSLLPKYRGLNTHQRALEAKDELHGPSVHFVSEELDGGAVIVQAPIAVESDDTVESLAARVHTQEHKIYPLAAQWFAEGRLELKGSQALLDGEALGAQGVQFT